MSNLTKSLIALTVGLIFTNTAMSGGPNNTGYVSSTDVLAPFLCEFNNPPDCEVIGTSTLYRTAAGVGINIVVADLMPNTPHTIWMVVFNNPNACAGFPKGPCGLGDLGNAAAQASLIWAAGNYTDDDGNGFFQAFVTDGPTGRQQPAGLPGDAGGLVNPNRAEIHFILRKHPIVPGEEYDAINSLNGSCPGGVGCEDLASAIHIR